MDKYSFQGQSARPIPDARRMFVEEVLQCLLAFGVTSAADH